MGDSWIESNTVESISLSKEFKRICPYFISIGMTYEQFWYEDPTIATSYLKAFKIKQKREIEILDYKMWKQGMYIYEALCDVSPILHAFCKKGTKPLPYPETPYGYDKNKTNDINNDGEKDKKITQQEIENERLKAQIFFSNWARATRKHFEKKEGDENRR